MMIVKRSNIIILGILLVLVMMNPGSVLAADLTLEEAIKLGLDENSDIRKAQDSVDNLVRELALITAKQDWQVKLGADYSNNPEEGKDNLIGEINISKEFSSGFTINPKLNIYEDDSDLTLKITQSLFPFTPTEVAQNYYKTERKLLKSQENLAQQKTSKILSWLESYLELSRVYEQKEIYQLGVKKAKDNLVQVLKRQEIGDAGLEEVLTAQLSLEEVKYSLQETEKNIEEVSIFLNHELGLQDKGELVFETQSQFIVSLREKADELLEKYSGMDELISEIEQNNYDILANQIDREILEQELEWLKAEKKTNLDLSGSYDTDEDEFTVGLNLSYDLYDGGQYKLEIEDKEDEIEDYLGEYNDLHQELKLQLQQYKNIIELAQATLNKQKLTVQRSEFKVQVAEQQLEMGLIDYLEYQEEWLDSKEAGINLGSSHDQLLINKLELIKFVNINELMEVF